MTPGQTGFRKARHCTDPASYYPTIHQRKNDM